MKDRERKRRIIENYVAAYNDFDVERMLRDLAETVIFRNISNGEVDLTTDGIDQFRRQAEAATKIFSRRNQTITGWKFGENTVEVEIDYHGTLAADLPNGLKTGERIALRGKSVFRFADDKIVALEDLS